MIIVRRVLTGVTESFPARASEWLLSIALVRWGVILLDEAILFESPTFKPLASIASEETWGWLAIVAGTLRIFALIINGTFRGTWYSNVSPHVRCGMSFVACFIWAQISMGLHASGVPTTGLAVYPILFLLDGWNAIRAAGDVGAMRALKNGPV